MQDNNDQHDDGKDNDGEDGDGKSKLCLAKFTSDCCKIQFSELNQASNSID